MTVLKIYKEDTGGNPSYIFQDEALDSPLEVTEVTSVANFINLGFAYGISRQEVLSQALNIIPDWSTEADNNKTLVNNYIQDNTFTSSIPSEVRDSIVPPYKGFKIFNSTDLCVQFWTGAGWGNCWSPTSVTLGDGFSNGASLSLNGGAGIYVAFSQNSNNEYLFNIALERDKMSYDGSNLVVALYWMKFGNSGGTVKWELDYSFINLGDDAYSKKDGTKIKTIDVTSLTDQTITNTKFEAISGDVGSKMLQLTLRRKSSGGESDTFAGDSEMYGFNLEQT